MQKSPEKASSTANVANIAAPARSDLAYTTGLIPPPPAPVPLPPQMANLVSASPIVTPTLFSPSTLTPLVDPNDYSMYPKPQQPPQVTPSAATFAVPTDDRSSIFQNASDTVISKGLMQASTPQLYNPSKYLPLQDTLRNYPPAQAVSTSIQLPGMPPLNVPMPELPGLGQ
ncbi:unnamed protein product [Protopolystoma xenopodis]|uniref:Uncharacterized protein n=1 Tax=Protopolystoma xenopodis TaxID=117903 RepID=A0A3S5BW22_9PLAT|nr:unnamed protein product [Protopolystoma xenopodis]